jgi:rod shape determining protein RodA
MRDFVKGIHWPIFLLSVGITFSSFLFIYSATFRGSENYMMKQFAWLCLGLLSFLSVVTLGYRRFLNMSYLIYFISIVFLVLVLIHGHVRHGAQRWISIGSFILQPSEFCKVATVLVLARFLSDQARKGTQAGSFLTGAFLVIIPIFLILKQPDLGSALVFVPLLIGMLFIWGIRIRYLIGIALLGLTSLPFAWFLLRPYQQKRLLVFLDPNADPLGSGYTAMQSKIAVGSGGLVGKGWLHGTQTQLDFVPEHHTDFIFCVIGEEFGFLGSLLLIVLFCCLIGYFIQVMERTTDLKARILAAGITSMFMFQLLINIGMTIGVAPITGITLPLVSYGGSSMIATFICLGFLTSIHKERSIF